MTTEKNVNLVNMNISTKSDYDNHGFSDKEESVAISYPVNVSKSSSKKLKWTCCQMVFIILGSLFALVGIIMLAGAYQALFDAILKSQMEIEPGSQAYDIWRLTPVPLYICFHIFNLTNPKDFQKGSKAILDEVGPYCYREYHEKQNLTFHDNKTVTFLQQRWWIWDQEASGNLSQDDVIITLNTIPVSAAWSVRDKPLMLFGLNTMLVTINEELTVETTVGEILFNGTSDPLLDWMHDQMANSSINLPDVIDIPAGLLDYDKFGWFYKRNLSLTYDGLYNMHTGQDTLQNLGLIDWWNYEYNTTFFDYPCNEVTGSAGELWPPGLQKDFIQFFSSDLCMSVKLFYKGEITDNNNVAGYRYWGTNETFANETVVPGNECYCVKGTCAPTGLLNAESCRMGSPAFISFPHFLNADPFLLDGVEGMTPPEEEIHSFFIDIIPEVGTPMSVSARMQINMHVVPYPGTKFPYMDKVNILSEVTEVYLPLLWFEETAQLPPDMARQLKILLFIMNTPTTTIIFSLFIGLGLLTVIIVLGERYRTKKHSKV
ncbi:protein croquemort-like [Cherax quadricarinatus]